MKTSIAKLAFGLTLVSMSSIAMAGIANTKHNLGSTNGADGDETNFTTSTTEICVFCHTPHGADSSAAVPLWNRDLHTNINYITYSSIGSATFDVQSAAIGSVSLACLSCHDGTQAMNTTIRNGPGSGNEPVGSFSEFQAFSEAQPAEEMMYIGTDLSNDHPVSIQYAGALTDGHGVIDQNDDFHTAEKSATVNGAGDYVWYIDTGTAGKQKTDLPLYARVGGTALDGEPLVECATCHDPHSEHTTFLRHPEGNNGSKTCLTCHDK